MYYVVLEIDADDDHEARKWAEATADNEETTLLGIFKDGQVVSHAVIDPNYGPVTMHLWRKVV